MNRLSGARHPLWVRAFVIAGFIASIVTGASLGFEQRVRPVAVASAAAPSGVNRPGPTRHLEHRATQFFVVPQPVQYSPYGSRITIPEIGTPAAIRVVTAANGKPALNCDLLSGVISESVIVTDAEGNPVSGATVEFTVYRSDVEEPQFVSDSTGFDGIATLSLKVPNTVTTGGAVVTYSIIAEAPAGQVNLHFPISDFTCAGATGAN